MTVKQTGWLAVAITAALVSADCGGGRKPSPKVFIKDFPGGAPVVLEGGSVDAFFLGPWTSFGSCSANDPDDIDTCSYYAGPYSGLVLKSTDTNTVSGSLFNASGALDTGNQPWTIRVRPGKGHDDSTADTTRSVTLCTAPYVAGAAPSGCSNASSTRYYIIATVETQNRGDKVGFYQKEETAQQGTKQAEKQYHNKNANKMDYRDGRENVSQIEVTLFTGSGSQATVLTCRHIHGDTCSVGVSQ